jgi:FkbM family methyltransferase
MNIEDIFSIYGCSPKGIIHIGACMCEELNIYLKYGLTNKNIIWIEGNPETYKYAKTILPTDVKLYNALIADSSYIVDFVVTNNICSSSMLELKDHLKVHPDVIESKKIRLITTNLTSFLIKYNLDIDNYNMLVMDIQGAEFLALEGMKDIISKFKYIFLEVSTIELYEKNAKFTEIKKFLNDFNFELVCHKLNEFNWGDAYFVKN